MNFNKLFFRRYDGLFKVKWLIKNWTRSSNSNTSCMFIKFHQQIGSSKMFLISYSLCYLNKNYHLSIMKLKFNWLLKETDYNVKINKRKWVPQLHSSVMITVRIWFALSIIRETKQVLPPLPTKMLKISCLYGRSVFLH